MPILESLRKSIEQGHPQVTENLVREALDHGLPSLMLIEEAMMPAMSQIGEQYKANQADILSILAAARCVRKGLTLIEMEDSDFREKNLGTILLGTIEGDLHDVGKTLVAIMLRSAGFRVIDLGVDISEKQFLQAVRKNPDVQIVCISSLLSTSLTEMEQVVRSLRRYDPARKIKIMVGGGALTSELAQSMGADAYTENCVEAVEVARAFLAVKKED